MENPIKKIDFTELRTQKGTLIVIIDELQKKQDIRFEDLDGILNLIDSIQDYAVDELGVPEMLVYDFELEESRDGETPEETFARVNADIIFQMHIEGTALFDEESNGGMSREFIEKIVDDSMHASLIKNLMRLEILNDVREYPDSFQKDANGKLTYDANMYDYGFTIEHYCTDKFNEGKTKCVHLCMHCGSDNVQVKAWVQPNANNAMVDEVEGDELGWCNDCNLAAVIQTASVKASAKVIGFQVVGEDGTATDGEIHPKMKGSFCIYNLSQARKMLKDKAVGEQWRLLTLWEGDVEEPTIMFKGDPRD